MVTLEMNPTMAPATRKQSASMTIRAASGRRRETAPSLGNQRGRAVSFAPARASAFSDIWGAAHLTDLSAAVNEGEGEVSPRYRDTEGKSGKKWAIRTTLGGCRAPNTR